jgi:hypothetical protein
MSDAKQQRMEQQLQEKKEAIVALALVLAKLKDPLSNTKQESNNKAIDNSLAPRRAAKRKAMEQLLKEKRQQRLKKKMK